MEIKVRECGTNSSLAQILDCLFSVVAFTETAASDSVELIPAIDQAPGLLDALLLSFMQLSTKKISADWLQCLSKSCSFSENEIYDTSKLNGVECLLHNQPDFDVSLKTAVSYLLDELICNIQQHSMCHDSIVYARLNASNSYIDVCVSDNGISLYGSYVKSGQYLEKLNDSISALFLAKDGFSTKNRPDVENRGYGISSNVKMVVEGLQGSFAIISGNALYLNTGDNQRLISLPEQIEWQGTTIIARIPNKMPQSFNIYDYIS